MNELTSQITQNHVNFLYTRHTGLNALLPQQLDINDMVGYTCEGDKQHTRHKSRKRPKMESVTQVLTSTCSACTDGASRI